MASSPVPVEVRTYVDADATATLAAFLAAIQVTASADYSGEQIAAWASDGDRDLADWNTRRHELDTIVATVRGEVAGFSDVSADGYIDMLFVAPQHGRRGVGTALLREVHRRALASGARALTTHASITARPFFEQHGFSVVAVRHPMIRGVSLTNYDMVAPLGLV